MLSQEVTLESVSPLAPALVRETLTHLFPFEEPLPRILACDARVVSCRSVPQDKGYRAEGEAEFILYHSASGRLCTQSARVPFSLPVSVQAEAAQADCLIGPVQLRREGDLAYRAECGIEVSLRAFTRQSHTLIEEIREPAAVTDPLQTAYLTGETRHACRIDLQEDVLIDPVLPEAEAILACSGSLTVTDCSSQAGEVQLSGHFTARVLYSPKGEGLPVTCHFDLPVSTSVRCDAFSEGASPAAVAGAADIDIHIYGDVQEEARLLHLNTSCELTLYEARTEMQTLVRDAFLPDRELQLSRIPVPFPQAPIHRSLSVPVQLRLPPEGEMPESVLFTLPRWQTETLVSGASGSKLSGTANLQLIALDARGGLRTLHLSAPVQWDIATCTPDADIFVQELILETRIAGGEWHISGTALLQIHEYPVLTHTAVQTAEAGEALPQSAPCLRLLIAQEGDALWDLAKRARVAPDTVAACNPDLGPVCAGCAVLIPPS